MLLCHYNASFLCCSWAVSCLQLFHTPQGTDTLRSLITETLFHSQLHWLNFQQSHSLWHSMSCQLTSCIRRLLTQNSHTVLSSTFSVHPKLIQHGFSLKQSTGNMYCEGQGWKSLFGWNDVFLHVCSLSYRKVVLNNCTKGVKEMYTARKQQCPNRSPKGLTLNTKDGKLTANMGSNVTFIVHLDEVRTQTACSCHWTTFI